MGKVLVIAEKPSVGRDIAKVLKCTTKGEGCLIGEEYVVSWAIGHLVTLAEPEDYDPSFKKWNFQSLPILPQKMKLKPVKKTVSQLKILRRLMNDKDTESLICATDSGREGELIFRYIYEITKCKKQVKRLWISSMTDIAIKEGFAHLKDSREYDLLYLSAKCRSEADWLVGINATRAYTLKYNALLSIGRVQTPTLAMIVARQKEIDAFETKDYYEVQAEYDSFQGMWFEEKDRSSKIESLQKAEEIAEKVKDCDAVVEKTEKEEKRQLPPLLYDLTELQRDCNKKFGFSAQKTLNLAQDLYEKRKMITYPRTDSRYLSDDMVGKIKNTLKKLSGAEPYRVYGEEILQMEKLPLSKRIIDNSKVTDHHAIIPTDGNIRLESLSEDERKVYNLVAVRFLAAFYPNYVYSITRIFVLAEGEHFLSKGTTVLQAGWTALYQALDMERQKEKKTDTGEDQILPEVAEGQAIHIQNAKVLKKKTKPPSSYTESSLLSAMENAGRFVEDETLKEQLKESGIGTPATRAAMIERLLTVGYIFRKGKSLIPTKKGMQLIEIVPEELKSPQTTGKWEKGLSSISKGKMTDKRFMESISRYVQFLIGASANIKKNVVFEAEQRGGKRGKIPSTALGKCRLCASGSILENSKSYYCTNWRNGCKFSLWKNSVEPYGITLNNTMVKKLLKEGKIDRLAISLPQTGEKCTATLTLCPDNSGKVELINVIRKEITFDEKCD